jgi:hypothetical protein
MTKTIQLAIIVLEEGKVSSYRVVIAEKLKRDHCKDNFHLAPPDRLENNV